MGQAPVQNKKKESVPMNNNRALGASETEATTHATTNEGTASGASETEAYSASAETTMEINEDNSEEARTAMTSNQNGSTSFGSDGGGNDKQVSQSHSYCVVLP